MKNFHRILVLGTSALALAGCDASEIISPGTSGDIIINNPAPTPAPTSGGGGTGSVTPAAGCPTVGSQALANAGTISGPSGEWRVCELPSQIDDDMQLSRFDGVLYSLPGRVDVGEDGGSVPGAGDTDVTLTIDPGVIIYAGTPRSYLVVNRGNQINAVGTASQPIIFTSRDNVLGLSSDSSIGQWGGVVLLGRAPVSDCRGGSFNLTPQSDCEQELEGAALTTLFGGDTPDDSSGTMQYFQIRFSGFSLENGSELQSLTTGGIGSGTVIDHWQSFNSSDDGTEFFGGTVNMSQVVVVGADDDSLDVDTGAQASLKDVIVVQRSGGGDNLIELDSPDAPPPDGYDADANPQTVLSVTNFTFIERSTKNSQAVRARGGAQLHLANGVIDTDAETCIRLDEQITIDAGPTFNSVVADCDPARPFDGEAGDDSDVLDIWNAGSNNDEAFTLTLSSTYINGSNENGVAVYDPTGLSSFFTTVPTNIGAVYPGNDAWFNGWVCTSSTAAFASSTGACTDIPVF